MENRKLNYYNLYGFVLAVEDSVNSAFELEYWRFRTRASEKVDLYVLETKKKDLPIKLRHDDKGISISFDKKSNKVFYEPGVKSDWVLYTIEPLIRWKDKCFLHCGAVSKNGEAIIFPAEGGVGKTTMATYLVRRGYEYLSDDWLIIGKDGKAYPFFKTVHVFDYNLKDKGLARRVLGSKRWYYKTLFFMLDLIPLFFRHRFARIVSERLKPIFSVDITKIMPGTKLAGVSEIKKIYWLKKDPSLKKPIIRKASYLDLAEKMPYITALETNHFYKNYLEYVYNNSPNKEFENKIEFDKEIFKSAFKKAEVYELVVPKKINPIDVEQLLK